MVDVGGLHGESTSSLVRLLPITLKENTPKLTRNIFCSNPVLRCSLLSLTHTHIYLGPITVIDDITKIWICDFAGKRLLVLS